MPRRAVTIAALGLLLCLALAAPALAVAGAAQSAPPRPLVRGQNPQRGPNAPGAGPAVAIPLASGTLGHRLRTYFSKSSTLVLLGVLVVCSLVLVVLRRRANSPRQRRGNRTADEQ